MGRYQCQKLLGKKIKKYNLVQVLGSGSYGTVYKAVIDSKKQQFLAVKAMSKTQMKQIPKLKELVQSQIQILKSVKSQNVIKFIDSFSSGDTVFIVTQFCNGGDLQKYCQKKGKIPQTEAISFLKQILNGFKGLHQINTMHRDFKLANVLLHNHVCKIADLGFAKILKQKGLTGTLLGTDETMAPQVHEEQKYGWGADIWSIGVVFFQMIYGHPPFRGANSYQILQNIKTTTPKYDEVDVSQQTLDFLQKCLVYDPNKRISWKQIYDHPIVYKSDINLTAGQLRCSRIDMKILSTYYKMNEQQKRKTINYGQQNDIYTTNKGNKSEDYFQNAGQIKNADRKADQIQKIKQDYSKKFEQYEQQIIDKRNDIMFGITLSLPLQKQLSKIQISHCKPLYEICKRAFIQLKSYRKSISFPYDKNLKQQFQYWQQFKKQQTYTNLMDRLLEDQIFIQSLALSYKYSIDSYNENINRQTQTGKFRDTIRDYRKQLTPYIRKQSKKGKPKFIRMLKAFKLMEERDQWDIRQFMKDTQNMDLEREEKYLKNQL